MQKRGISPLIATVLIIGFTVALAAIIITWGNTFFIRTTEKTSEEASISTASIEEVGLRILKVIPFSTGIDLTIENSGERTIESIVVRVTNVNGEVFFVEDFVVSLDPFDINTYTIDFGQQIGQIDLVEVIPKVDFSDIADLNEPVALGSKKDEFRVPTYQLLLDGSSCSDNRECESGVCQASGGGPDSGILKCQPQNGYRVFVSSQGHNGNFGGVSGADAFCQAYGSVGSATSGGTWKAWISSSTSNAAGRLYHSPVPYRKTDGIVVANDWNDLVDGFLNSGIDVNENGGSASSNIVWTGTDSTGMYLSAIGACSDWMSGAFGQEGAIGLSGSTNDAWTYDVTISSLFRKCDVPHDLYCFEQPSQCTSDNINSGCDNGNACDTNDQCDANGQCIGGTPVIVDDGNPCTDDSCDPFTGVANVNVPAGGERTGCDGPNSCNGAGVCVQDPVCGNGPPAEYNEQCDDGANGILTDGCSDTCQFTVPLTACPASGIPAGGWIANTYYYLNVPTEVTSTSSICFNINANDIVLDCNGKRIRTTGSGSGGGSVEVDASGVTIKNCFIDSADWSIRLDTQGSGDVTNNNVYTTHSIKPAIRINSNNNVLTGNTVCRDLDDSGDKIFITSGTTGNTDNGLNNNACVTCDGAANNGICNSPVVGSDCPLSCPPD